jgi:hypothetical protein
MRLAASKRQRCLENWKFPSNFLRSYGSRWQAILGLGMGARPLSAPYRTGKATRHDAYPLKRPHSPVAPSVNGKLAGDIELCGSASFGEKSLSFIVMTALSVVIVRLAIVLVYPKRVEWDE